MSLDTDAYAVRQAVRGGVAVYRGRLSDRLEALGVDDWRDHQEDTQNPHETTQAQIQLQEVSNLPIAQAVDVVAGVSDELYVILGQLSLVLEDITHPTPGPIRAPSATPSRQVLEDNEGVVTLSATPFAARWDLPTEPTFQSREYRFVGVGIQHSETLTTQDPLVVDISALGTGMYLWQCRDTTTDNDVSPWSFPAWVELYRWANP